MSLMVEAKMAAPLSTSCLQRWTLLQEAAQCSGVLQGVGGEGAAWLLEAQGPGNAEPQCQHLLCYLFSGVISTNKLSWT